MKKMMKLVFLLGLILAIGSTLPSATHAQAVWTTTFLCFSGFIPPDQLEVYLQDLALSCKSFVTGSPYQEKVKKSDVIRVKADKSLSFYLAILHSKPNPTFPIFLLIDGLQQAFQLEGEEAVVHQLFVPLDDGSFQPHAFYYEVPALPPGLHNVIIATFSVSPDDVMLAPSLQSIYAGEGTIPKVSSLRPPDSAFRMGITRPVEETQFPWEGIFLSLSPNPSREELKNGWVVRLQPGQRLRYFIGLRAACVDDQLHDYQVMVFLNELQIPIEAEDRQRLVLVRLACEQEIWLDASLIAPQKPGEYLLIPFAIINPYARDYRDPEKLAEKPLIPFGPVPKYVVKVTP